MSNLLSRAWRWRLRTKRDYRIMTALLGIGSLVNLVIFDNFTMLGVLATVAGLITAYWIVSNVLPPKDGP